MISNRNLFRSRPVRPLILFVVLNLALSVAFCHTTASKDQAAGKEQPAQDPSSLVHSDPYQPYESEAQGNGDSDSNKRCRKELDQCLDNCNSYWYPALSVLSTSAAAYSSGSGSQGPKANECQSRCHSNFRCQDGLKLK